MGSARADTASAVWRSGLAGEATFDLKTGLPAPRQPLNGPTLGSMTF
jgi:hypothetical protein